jgi:Holliday junction resolvasome RuvABC endonuclease subunit
MRFVAIDSSLSNTGIAIGTITEDGSIQVEKIQLCETEKTKHKQVRASSDTIDRCRKTHRFIHKILDAEMPDIVFVETPSGSQSSAGMKSYGATCALIASVEPDPIEVTPVEVKVAFTGSKEASKVSIINKAVGLYPQLEWYYHAGKLQAKNEHCADAIAIAYAAVQTSEFARLKNIITHGKVI